MTLGEKLKNTLAAMEQANILKFESKISADLSKIIKERNHIEATLKKMQETFVKQINNHQIPFKKIPDGAFNNWIKSYWLGYGDKAVKHDPSGATHTDLWYAFVNAWATEGLAVKVKTIVEGPEFNSRNVITLDVLAQGRRPVLPGATR
jgi:hypothetical protein